MKKKIKAIANLTLTDHEADAFKPPGLDRHLQSPLESSLIGALTNWDGRHFLNIAQNGYIYEHSVAFFPLFPALVRLTNAFQLVSYTLCACLINFVLFNVAVVYLYKLTLVVFAHNKQLALLTCVFFCINPASIFFSAVYSETLYAALTLASLYYLLSSRLILASILLYLTSLTRSNGLLNAAFFAYFYLRWYVEDTFYDKDKHTPPSPTRLVRSFLEKRNLRATLLLLSRSSLAIVAALSGFFSFQYFVYLKFCVPSESSPSIDPDLIEYGRRNNYVLFDDESGRRPAWCYNTIPLSYSWVQTYWDNGFLAYWQLKQIPNFFLAAPIIILSVHSILNFFRSFEPKQPIYDYFGILASPTSAPPTSAFKKNPLLYPFVVHLAVLVVSVGFFMNVQVTKKYVLILNYYILFFIFIFKSN